MTKKAKTPKKSASRKYPKLRGKAKAMASKYIAEEMESGYPRKQAIAIGLSRARIAAKKPRKNKK